MASPDSKDIKALIYEVEYRNEKFNSREAQTAREQAANEKARNEMALRFVGTWRHDFQLSGYDRSVFLIVKVGPDGKLQIARDPEKPFEPDPKISEISISGEEVRYKSRYTGLDFSHTCAIYNMTAKLSPDGRSLILDNQYVAGSTERWNDCAQSWGSYSNKYLKVR